ncbi:MAG: alpha-xylosidase, partial [Anaerolineae bacterium]|nr:alpha-xylosidase [Anaerolineae bacterium]
HSRLHGSQSYRVPWLFDDEAVDVLRHFTKLKCRLMPYLFNAAIQAHGVGTPMMRAMMFEFPDDPACDYLDRQYMLGDSLLVVPVFTPDGSVDYYLPEGHWTHLLTGQVIEGGRWRRENHDFMSLPLLVRPNSVLAVGNRDDLPDYDYSDGLTLQIYQLDDGATVTVSIPSISGDITTTFDVKREGETITVAGWGHIKDWRVLLAGIDAVEPIAAVEVDSSPQGVIVTPPAGTDHLEIVLPAS